MTSPLVLRLAALAAAVAAPVLAVSCGSSESALRGAGGNAATTASSAGGAATGHGGTGHGAGGHGGAAGSGGATGSAGHGGSGGDATGAAGHAGSGGATGDAGHAGSGGATGGAGHGGSADAGLGDSGDAAACATQEVDTAPLPSPHVATCSPLSFATNPPTSGPHYPIWAAYESYTEPVPRGFWIHDLEHGGVVIAYNCPGGCAAEVAAIESFVSGLPVDPLCSPPVQRRVVVTPDPLLDVKFAAVAWGAALKADCVDTPALGAFVSAHYAKAPEDFCGDGIDPTNPDAGVPADCGDASDAGDAAAD
jgi:hypothetical protein